MPDLQSKRVVALLNASDDTADMFQRMLAVSGVHRLVWCHLADVKKGEVDFAQFLAEHNPHVVIFDISPPYEENWQCYQRLHDSEAMQSRGFVLTTTNKARLDEVVGTDSHALEIVGEPYDQQQIMTAIEHASRNAPPETPRDIGTASTRTRRAGSRRSGSRATRSG
jgi:DNA-binding response OmpR family regulator